MREAYGVRHEAGEETTVALRMHTMFFGRCCVSNSTTRVVTCRCAQENQKAALELGQNSGVLKVGKCGCCSVRQGRRCGEDGEEDWGKCVH
jgi:hypothetical protein